MDQIIVEDLQIYAYHGVYQQENEKGQNFYVSVILDTDTRAAGMADELGLSTNYGVVCRFLHTFLSEHTYKLIETAAERASEALLLQFPHVRQVTMEVKKPEAPIRVPFGSVSVKITRGWRRAYIACGSNIGDRRAHLGAAVDELLADRKCRVLRVSDWVETTPQGWSRPIISTALCPLRRSIRRKSFWRFCSPSRRRRQGSARRGGGQGRLIWISFSMRAA